MTIRWIIAVGVCVAISNALPSAADYKPIGMSEASSDPPVRHDGRSWETVTIAQGTFGETVGDPPIGGPPVGGEAVGDPPIGGPPIGGQPVRNPPLGDESLYGEPVGNPPVGDEPLSGEPVGNPPIESEPLY